MRRRGRNRAFLEAVPAFTAAPADSGTSWPDPYRAHAYCERNEDAKAAAPAACGTDNRLACIGTIVGSSDPLTRPPQDSGTCCAGVSEPSRSKAQCSA